ncbi:HAD domain-containing protein [Actinomadura sp. 6N118]|uniref:HAD domain-containing protein n=1 Tax=Actinomadura sp. 6N118 TaxID=3375151 RepID=UPI0037B7FEE3
MLYLDIDGVLNPTGLVAPESFVEHAVARLTVRISSEHQCWLRELGECYELVWASTWEKHANEFIGPLLGLPELPFVSFTTYQRRPDDPRVPVMQVAEMRKWAPILRHANGRRFAWVDDEIPLRARRQALPHRGMKLMQVNQTCGLTRRHVDRLLSWAAGFPGGSQNLAQHA